MEEIIRKWNLWCLNFDSSLYWMHEIWDKTGLADHMIGKFRDLQSSVGSSAMVYFFLGLDEENRQKLVEWFEQNYKG